MDSEIEIKGMPEWPENLAHKLVLKALRGSLKNVNMYRMGRRIGTTRIWWYLHNRVAWKADTWLKFLYIMKNDHVINLVNDEMSKPTALEDIMAKKATKKTSKKKTGKKTPAPKKSAPTPKKKPKKKKKATKKSNAKTTRRIVRAESTVVA